LKACTSLWPFLLLSFLTHAHAGAHQPDTWGAALSVAADAVVSIQVDAPVAFDTNGAGSSSATGFVVDAERGIVLTNRHVIRTGPVVATATFRNREQVDLVPLYRDPVHDFGFFRYDPEALAHMRPRALALRPDKARVGLDIRVVGNDSGEQMSIHAGTLARLDRNAPNYGTYRYNDFNTFYFQAATGTSGGSSGSPVLDSSGDVVALNAGGNRNSAASFYLPLERVQRAFELLRDAKPVPRGTLQTVFTHASFSDLRGFGLTEATQARVRAADAQASGMLVVHQVVPGGPADGSLEEGDILVAVDGQTVIGFVPLEARLDGALGESVSIQVERAGKALQFDLRVADMHAMEPERFVELGGAVLHDLSYQQTRNLAVPREGVYLANAGYMFGRAGVHAPAVITHVNGKPVADLAAFAQHLESLGEVLQVRYFTPGRQRTPFQALVHLDRQWFGARACDRRDGAARWDCRAFSVAEPAPGRGPMPAAQASEPQGTALTRRIGPSLVTVRFDMPFTAAGTGARHLTGVGLVVDAQEGLVVVDRRTVPISLGDARITFGGAVEVPARVVYLHPLHNLALLAYEPERLGVTPAAAARLAEGVPSPGDEVRLVGLRTDHNLTVVPTAVAAVRSLDFQRPAVPRFQESNLDAVELTYAPAQLGGVVAAEDGTVQALWARFSYQSGNDTVEGHWGIPAEFISELVSAYRTGVPLHSLETKLAYVSIARARQLGLPDIWAGRLAASEPSARVLYVEGTVAGSPAAGALRSGDLLLAIDGVPVTRYRDVERLSQATEVEVTLLRDWEVQSLHVATRPLPGVETEHVVQWAGAFLHAPHRAIGKYFGLPEEGVYVASRSAGSPANRNGLPSNVLITAVEGVPVRNLEQFLARVGERVEADTVHLGVLSLSGRRYAIAVRPDDHYWPTQEIQRMQGGWQRMETPRYAGAPASG
jgi:pro-apoptotic serine protease NMA111